MCRDGTLPSAFPRRDETGRSLNPVLWRTAAMDFIFRFADGNLQNTTIMHYSLFIIRSAQANHHRRSVVFRVCLILGDQAGRQIPDASLGIRR